MSYYDSGCDDEMGGILTHSPSVTRQSLAATNALYADTDRLVRTTKGLALSTPKVWQALKQKWDDFYVDAKGVRAMRDFTYYEGMRYRTALSEFRAKFLPDATQLPKPDPKASVASPSKRGGAVNPDTGPTQDDAKAPFRFPWKPVLIVGGIGIAGYVVYRVVRATPAARAARLATSVPDMIPAPSLSPPYYTMSPFPVR